MYVCRHVSNVRMSGLLVWPSIPPGNSAGSTASARGRHGESKATSSLAGHRTKGFNLKQPQAEALALCAHCTLLDLNAGKRCHISY